MIGCSVSNTDYVELKNRLDDVMTERDNLRRKIWSMAHEKDGAALEMRMKAEECTDDDPFYATSIMYEDFASELRAIVIGR